MPPVILAVVVMLILASMQLAPGTFSIFYHFMLGKYSRKKADNLSLSFIFGTELFMVAIWLLTYFILYAFFTNLTDYQIFLWIFAGISVAESVSFFLFYFRSPASRKSTALFVPRRFTNTIMNRITTIKTRKDAFLLGFFIGVPELVFTLPLFIITNTILLNTTLIPTAFTIALIVFITILPLFVVRTLYRAGYTLASIHRFRVHLKPTIRILLPLGYLIIAIILITGF